MKPPRGCSKQKYFPDIHCNPASIRHWTAKSEPSAVFKQNGTKPQSTRLDRRPGFLAKDMVVHGASKII